MKVNLILPFYDQPRGNKVTVERISSGLNKFGVETEIISSTAEGSANKQLKADIIHGFHAYQFSLFLKRKSKISQPYMLTLTGTDLNHDLYHPERREAVIETLVNAKAIHVFEEKAINKLLIEVPSLRGKVHVVPQGVNKFNETNASIEKEDNTFVFILPAGIRKVKRVPEAISMLSTLKDKYNYLRLWIVGPIIEDKEWAVVKELINKNSEWVTYLGQFPHKEMGAIYKHGDVVLNTSISEGQPSAVLESMLLGTPPLVSNIDGNRSIVTHDITGFLYNDVDEFISYSERLMNEAELRKKFALASKTYVKNHHSATGEIEKILSIYNTVMRQYVIQKEC